MALDAKPSDVSMKRPAIDTFWRHVERTNVFRSLA
jgi:hypothetical protein